MGRPRKIGLNFYSSDTDRYQDLKIKRLKNQFGCAGIAVYDYVLNEIYRVRGCFIEWDENTVFDVADYFRIKESLVSEIINYCCSVGLYDKELRTNESVLTSKSIQLRYIDVCTKAKRKDFQIPTNINLIPYENELTTEESRFTTEETPFTPEESTQRKVKESKVKKRKDEKEKISTSSTKGVLFPIDKLSQDYLENTELLEIVSQVQKITIENIKKKIPEFVKHLKSQNQFSKESNDFASHFLNWLKKNKREKPISTKYENWN